MTQKSFSTWIKAAAAASALMVSSAAHADLMLYPTRIVMTGNQRSAQVQIINRGDKPETYRINIVNNRMSDTGEIVQAKTAEPGEQFADTMLVHTPRQVTLQPGQSQTVRVSARRPAGLSDGEFRSYLQFDRVPDATAASDLESVTRPEAGRMTLSLQALVGVSIPVILRQGQTSVTVTLGKLAVIPATSEAPPALGFVFHRQGNQSAYGDVTVTYTPAGSQSVKVGEVSGIAVYVPNAMRIAQIPLTLPQGMALQGGTLTLLYNQRADVGGKLMAEAQIIVP